MSITRKGIASDVVKITGCSKLLAAQAVDAVFESLCENIIQGNHIEIRGFGSFDVKHANERTAARNPRTGEVVYVPARRKAFFKISKSLKNKLNQDNDK